MTVAEDGPSSLTPNQKGAIAEEAIAAEAAKLGIVVARPNVDARYDLIFDTGDSLLRVQCKLGTLNNRGDVVMVNTDVGMVHSHRLREEYVQGW